MTRFRTTVEELRKAPQLKVEPGSWYLSARFVQLAEVILLDVVKAVDAYERTIKDLKKQNNKLRNLNKTNAKGFPI